MGSIRSVNTVQSVERRPGVTCLRQLARGHRIMPHSALSCGDGIDVSPVRSALKHLVMLLTHRSDPVVGAQYRWSAQFAPIWPRFWGLFQGWMTVFAWVTCAAASPAYLAEGVQALMLLNDESYVPQAWHTTLLMCAFVLPPVAANLWFKEILNPMETVGALGHGAFWIASMILLGVTGARSSNAFVWKNITNDVSGWTSPGISFGIGLLPIAFPITSFDGVLHMSMSTPAQVSVDHR